jgi:hypothetical protein
LIPTEALNILSSPEALSGASSATSRTFGFEADEQAREPREYSDNPQSRELFEGPLLFAFVIPLSKRSSGIFWRHHRSDLDLTFALADDQSVREVVEDWTARWSDGSKPFTCALMTPFEQLS